MYGNDKNLKTILKKNLQQGRADIRSFGESNDHYGPSSQSLKFCVQYEEVNGLHFESH